MGREFSVENIIKFLNAETLYTYINALCKALIIKKIYRYDIYVKAVLIVLENIVYNELLIKGYEVYVGKNRNGEVDFLARKDGIVKYIQVTYELNNNDVLEKEFGVFKPINIITTNMYFR